MACDLNVLISGITGDCSSTSVGSFSIDVNGTAPGFTLQWVSPYTTTIPLTVNPYTFTGLSAGTYTFYVTDSCIPDNTQSSPINVYISSGTCVEILSITNTTCNLPNGNITVLNSNFYGNVFYYLYETTLGLIETLDPTEIISSQATFTNLSPGTYYVISDDGGGCTGKTESCIIKASTSLDFGFYTIPNAGCGIDSGSIYITGLTGIPPYTYLWDNGETTSTITGLTEGSYSVTITDGSGCQKIGGVLLEKVPPLGIVSLTTTSPSCFVADGEVITYITGGTAPFYYSGSNGDTIITFDTSYTFTGLPAGNFSVTVTDAGLCQFTSSTALLTPNSISVVSVDTTNSVCNNSGGEISISIFGGSPPYTYTLTDSNLNSSTFLQPTQNGGAVFTNLSSDTYILTITDSSGSCTYTQPVTISNTILFTLSTTTTGTTCNQNNGAVTLSITTGGTEPYTYEINGQSVVTNNLSYTFINLPSGNYTASVTDSNLCEQILPFVINSSNEVNFILNGINPIGNNGVIETFITSGEPPFTLNWSPNVNGQTGLTVNNLSAGTYTLNVTDSSGCTQERSINLVGYNLFSSYEVYNICDDDFVNTGQLVKKGLQQMLLEGFFDLTSGDTNCILNSAVFEAVVSVEGVITASTFYTSSGLNDFPSDNLFYTAVDTLLSSYPNIENVEIDVITGDLKVSTICNPPLTIMDATVIVDVKIYYDISCVECA